MGVVGSVEKICAMLKGGDCHNVSRTPLQAGGQSGSEKRLECIERCLDGGNWNWNTHMILHQDIASTNELSHSRMMARPGRSSFTYNPVVHYQHY